MTELKAEYFRTSGNQKLLKQILEESNMIKMNKINSRQLEQIFQDTFSVFNLQIKDGERSFQNLKEINKSYLNFVLTFINTRYNRCIPSPDTNTNTNKDNSFLSQKNVSREQYQQQKSVQFESDVIKKQQEFNQYNQSFVPPTPKFNDDFPEQSSYPKIDTLLREREKEYEQLNQIPLQTIPLQTIPLQTIPLQSEKEPSLKELVDLMKVDINELKQRIEILENKEIPPSPKPLEDQQLVIYNSHLEDETKQT